MKVIVAIDDSENSREIISSITKRKWPDDCQFKVLTVLEPLDLPEDELEELASTIERKRRQIAEKYCQSLRNELEATIPGAIVHYEIRCGHPKMEIIHSASEWGAERILVGAHGQRGCPYNLLGSVSRAVASHAPCSVEIVRAKRSSSRKCAEKEAVATSSSKSTSESK